MNIINHGVHISIFMSNNLPAFTTDDYELFDVMDDYLTEDCDFDFECLIYHDHPKKDHFTMEIESGITFDELVASITKFDLAEIEKIYRVNN